VDGQQYLAQLTVAPLSLANQKDFLINSKRSYMTYLDARCVVSWQSSSGLVIEQ